MEASTKRVKQTTPSLGSSIKGKKKKKHSGRRCKSCGKDPFPNYFYCPSCHHKLSHSDDEHDDIKML